MLVAEEVFDCVLSFGQCVRILRRLDFGAVASFLAVLSQVNEKAFDSAPLTNAGQVGHLTGLLAFMLEGSALERARSQVQKAEDRFVPLSTQALIATVELAGRFSPRQGRIEGLNAAERLRVSHVLLSFQSEALSRKLLNEFRDSKITDWAQVPRSAVEQFVRNMAAHNPNRPYANALARLLAYSRKRSIGTLFTSRKGRPMEQWFSENLAMSSEQYLVAAFLAGASSSRFKIERPASQDLIFVPDHFYGPLRADVKEQVVALLRVATIDGSVPWDLPRQSNTLADALYEANQLHATPVLAFGERRLIVSTTLLWNLCVCGLPHSSLNSIRLRQAAPTTSQQVKGIRGEFGMMFEGYVQWLFAEWFGGCPVRLYSGYEVNVDGRWRERDIAIVAKETAFVFEVKGHVLDLDLRRSGSYSALKRFVGEPVEQCYLAAEALLAGTARAANGESIPAVRRVIPVAIVYDPIPLSLYTGDHFETWLERALDLPVFTPRGGRSPVQMLSIDALEAAESALRMDISPEQLLAALLARADRPQLRYERFGELVAGVSGPLRPSPIRMLVGDTQDFVRALAPSLKEAQNSNTAAQGPN